MYNKLQFHKQNDHKIMRKTHKQWVIISTALLGAISTGLGMTQTNVHADSNDTNVNHSTSLANTSNQAASPNVSSSYVASNANSSATNNEKNIANTSSNTDDQSSNANTNHNTSNTPNSQTSNPSMTSNTNVISSSNNSSNSSTSNTSMTNSTTSMSMSTTSSSAVDLDASMLRDGDNTSNTNSNTSDYQSQYRSKITSMMSSAQNILNYSSSVAANSTYASNAAVTQSLSSAADSLATSLGMSGFQQMMYSQTTSLVSNLGPTLSAFEAMDSAYIATNDPAFSNAINSLGQIYNYYSMAYQAGIPYNDIIGVINSAGNANGGQFNSDVTKPLSMQGAMRLYLQMGFHGNAGIMSSSAAIAGAIYNSMSGGYSNAQAQFSYAESSASSIMSLSSIGPDSIYFLNNQLSNAFNYEVRTQVPNNYYSGVDNQSFLNSYSNSQWAHDNSVTATYLSDMSLYQSSVNSDFVSAWASAATSSIANDVNSLVNYINNTSAEFAAQESHAITAASMSRTIGESADQFMASYGSIADSTTANTLTSLYQIITANSLYAGNTGTPIGFNSITSRDNSIELNDATGRLDDIKQYVTDTFQLPKTSDIDWLKDDISKANTSYSTADANNPSLLASYDNNVATIFSAYNQMLAVQSSYAANSTAADKNNALNSQATSLNSSAQAALNSATQSASAVQSSALSQQASQNTTNLNSTIASLQSSANTALAQNSANGQISQSSALSAAQSLAQIQLNSAITSQSNTDYHSAQAVINSLNASAQSAINAAKISGNSELANQLASANSSAANALNSATQSVAQSASNFANSAFNSLVSSIRASAATDKADAVSNAVSSANTQAASDKANALTSIGNSNNFNQTSALSSAQSSYANENAMNHASIAAVMNAHNNDIANLQISLNQANQTIASLQTDSKSSMSSNTSTSSSQTPTSSSSNNTPTSNSSNNARKVRLNKVFGFHVEHNVLSKKPFTFTTMNGNSKQVPANVPVEIIKGTTNDGNNINLELKFKDTHGKFNVAKSAIKNHFVNRYYNKNEVKHITKQTRNFKIKTIKSIQTHQQLQFTKVGHKVKIGTILEVRAIRDYKGITRFVTKSNHIITSNKLFVKVLK